MQFRSNKDRLTQFILLSVIAHVLFAAVTLTMSRFQKPQQPIPTHVATKLVKLGQKRDPKLMPRLDTAPQQAPQPQAAAQEKKPVEASPPTPESKNSPPPQKAKTASEKAVSRPEKNTDKKVEKKTTTSNTPQKKSRQELLKERLGKLQKEEGDKNGSALGRDLDGQLRATYNSKVIALVQQSLTAPQTLTQSERIRLKSVVFFQIDASGQIQGLSIRQSSSNTAFDNTVLAAVKKAAPFPPPPFTARDFYAKGIGINVCPIRCR